MLYDPDVLDNVVNMMLSLNLTRTNVMKTHFTTTKLAQLYNFRMCCSGSLARLSLWDITHILVFFLSISAFEIQSCCMFKGWWVTFWRWYWVLIPGFHRASFCLDNRWLANCWMISTFTNLCVDNDMLSCKVSVLLIREYAQVILKGWICICILQNVVQY